MNLAAFLLQATPVVPTEGDLASTAEQLGRATSEIGVYNMITGAFLMIVLVFTCMQIYAFYNLTSKLSTISEASIKTMQFFNNKMMKDINIDQARSEIVEQLDKCASSMKFQILIMRELNHISDKEATMERIKLFVSNLYSRKFNHFKKFEFDERPLTEILIPDFNDSAVNLMEKLLYSDEKDFKVMYINAQVDDFYSQIKSSYNIRLDNL